MRRTFVSFFYSPGMDAFFASHEDAELTPAGKIRCKLTGHEVPAQVSLAEAYWSGPKYFKASGQHRPAPERSTTTAPSPCSIRHRGAVVAPGLLLGCKASQNDTSFTDGVTHVLCCADELVSSKRSWPHRKRLPLRERRRRGTDEEVDAIVHSGVTWAVEARAAGATVLIHCRHGLNRSVAVTCGVLIRERGIGMAEALACVRKAQRKASPDMQLRGSLNRLETRQWQ